jgi:hypothetical protein
MQILVASSLLIRQLLQTVLLGRPTQERGLETSVVVACCILTGMKAFRIPRVVPQPANNFNFQLTPSVISVSVSLQMS